MISPEWSGDKENDVDEIDEFPDGYREDEDLEEDDEDEEEEDGDDQDEDE